jgi:hypothetical protein
VSGYWQNVLLAVTFGAVAMSWNGHRLTHASGGRLGRGRVNRSATT